MNSETSSSAAAGAVVQLTAVVAAVSARPAPVEHTPGPCPPAAESLAECVRLGLIADNGDGTYRALQRGRTSPHDPGIVETGGNS